MIVVRSDIPSIKENLRQIIDKLLVAKYKNISIAVMAEGEPIAIVCDDTPPEESYNGVAKGVIGQ